MPFNTTSALFDQGIYFAYDSPNIYCQSNTSASDYGNCYNTWGQAIFVQTDTTNYPKLPCENNNTCIRRTTTAGVRTLATIFNYSGKQGILQYFWTRTHSLLWTISNNVTYIRFVAVPAPSSSDVEFLWMLPARNYEISYWPIYDPIGNLKVYNNPYTISSGNVAVLRWQGTYFTSTLYLLISEESNNNVWYAYDTRVVWAYESSPLAIIPLDYNNDYVPYSELRNAFGYAYTGIDQPGWNAQDIISVLRDIFPDRAWAVYDDIQKILYLYNLTMDYVPDWLINKLAPVGVKVLQSPSDSSIAQAWVDALNARNLQIPPPSSSV